MTRSARYRLALLLGVTTAVSAGWFAWASDSPAPPRSVFVSCHGDDRNAGSAAAPLRTPDAALASGATVALERGCSWNGSLSLRGEGNSLTAYGVGPAPVVTGGPVRLLGAHQLVRDLHVTTGPEAGIEVHGPDATVRDVQIDRVGIGVLVTGRAATVTRADVRDLHMVVDTPGGDDDYGAVGFNVQAADAEISGSSCVNCRAPSHDYGFDGGFAEIWNHGDRLSLHDNVVRNSDGILEVGGDRPDASARGVSVRDNRFDVAHGGFVLHAVGDRYGMATPSLVVSGNTIVNTSAADGPVLSGQIRSVRFDGNRVSTPGLVSASGPPASHTCNVYDLGGTGSVGFPLDPTERTTAGAAPC
ncbi:hypothetical protein HH310_16990 [Actinoplanes sp. TBRC 11911]|uniref:hypothetical protein n=1 Tax=Actinoplanes sp. TBRC 11911 TaxID=2729386 RepID=UPI00145F7B4A|nr:hypothetical protein [Actinoplanes sp. TBRC 11911]NMO52881.1 hypothetical protein [Actinoplanes sp. TBRC 11911]